MAALCKEMFWMCPLEIAAAYLRTRNLRCDRKDGNSAAMTIVKTVDQMQIAWTSTSGTHGQLFGQVRFSAGGERRRFFVSDRHPV